MWPLFKWLVFLLLIYMIQLIFLNKTETISNKWFLILTLLFELLTTKDHLDPPALTGLDQSNHNNKFESVAVASSYH